MHRAEPQEFSRVLSSMCTEPHPAAREAAERFLATNPGDPGTYEAVAQVVDGKGNVLESSPSVTFYIKQTSVLN